MKVKDICNAIESIAPVSYQEDYDNAGLIIGNPQQEVTQILLCLDSTEAVVDEAIAKGCNLIVAHHPLIFKGLKKINGKNDVERTVIKAIENKIAIYAAHTNLDNVLHMGVNQRFAQKLGLKNIQILEEKSDVLVKIVFYTPLDSLEKLKTILFDAGAGHIGQYSECSFANEGTGTFKPEQGSNPQVGKVGVRQEHNEIKVEAIAPSFIANQVVSALKQGHPYEEMAYEIIPISNFNQGIGAGVIGELENSLKPSDFLNLLKNSLKLEVIKYTVSEKEIKKVALCGGSGSFLRNSAMRSKADAYVTSDVKYHEFFDAQGKMLLCDIGHYESEKYTIDLFSNILSAKFPKFATIFAGTITNPIDYLT